MNAATREHRSGVPPIVEDTHPIHPSRTKVEVDEEDPVELSFIIEHDQACTGSQITFTNTSDGNGTDYLWDMGDGMLYTQEHVVHSYASPGQYLVQLSLVQQTSPPSAVFALEVNVLAPVQAIAEIDPPDPCGDMTLTGFSSSNSGNISHQWHMGDGTILEQATVEHAYQEPGGYTIMYVASDPTTCNLADTLTWDVVITGGDIAATLAFEVQMEQMCYSAMVSTINQSSDLSLQFHWDMGDGTSYTDLQVEHLYAASGYYMIVLSVIDPSACSGPVPHYVPVWVGEPLPVTAGFSASFEHTCEGTVMSATNYSGGENIAYLWSFGDGTGSNEQHVEHLYTSTGEMVLSLVVQDLNGCLPGDTMEQAIYIPSQPELNAGFDHVLMNNCQGGQFIGQTLVDAPVEYVWDMGDGTTLYGNYIDHQYVAAGSYDVILVAQDPNGCGSESSTVTVQVVMPVIMDLSFDMLQDSQCGQLTVTCTSTSIGNNLTYIWWTSDNYSYYGPEMQHTFYDPGEYEIRFYGMDPMDCSGPDSVVVVVVVEEPQPVNAEFTMSVSPQECGTATVELSVVDQGDDLVYAWTMGDGSTYDTPVVVHGYTTPGDHMIELLVARADGCGDPQVAQASIEVPGLPPIDAGMLVEQVGDCVGMRIQCNNLNAVMDLEWLWDMGDGTQYDTFETSHVYASPGTYIISLLVNDTVCQRQSMHTTPVTITDGVPHVQVSSTELCPGGSVSLDAGDRPGVYSWNTGSDLPVITVNSPGTYTVTVEGDDGCNGTASVVITAGVAHYFTDTVHACAYESVALVIPIEGQAFAWSNGAIERTIHVRGDGIYEFSVTDLDGCEQSGSFVVEALDKPLYVPTAFTPDGDGLNDIFTIVGTGVESARLSIYDRYGRMLHQTNEYPPAWNGFFQGDLVKQDVYVYQLEYRSACTRLNTNTTGHVTVVR